MQCWRRQRSTGMWSHPLSERVESTPLMCIELYQRCYLLVFICFILEGIENGLAQPVLTLSSVPIHRHVKWGELEVLKFLSLLRKGELCDCSESHQFLCSFRVSFLLGAHSLHMSWRSRTCRLAFRKENNGPFHTTVRGFDIMVRLFHAFGLTTALFH